MARRAAHDRMNILFFRLRAGARVSPIWVFLLAYLGSPMVFRRVPENIRGATRSTRLNEHFVFRVCVRAPAYLPPDFFYLVTWAPLCYSGEFGKIIRGATRSTRSNEHFFFRIWMRAPAYFSFGFF